MKLELVQSEWRTEFDRRDGLRLEREPGTWVIYSPNGEKLSECPCCRRAFQTLWAAQIAASRHFPLEK